MKILILALLVANQLMANNFDVRKPKWGMILGGYTTYNPDYPASDQNHFRYIVVPFPFYRTKNYSIDLVNGFKGKIYRDPHWELDIDLSGALPSSSADNIARSGMDDLDWMYGFGPKLKYTFAEVDANVRSSLHLPVRLISSTDFKHTEERGFIFNPYFLKQWRTSVLSTDLFSIVLGTEFATQKLHAYFFDVDSKFVTAGRGEYRSKGGYFGSYVGLGFSTQFENTKWYFRAYAQSRSGTANTESPLFKKEFTYAVTISFLYTFYKSQEQVEWDISD